MKFKNKGRKIYKMKLDAIRDAKKKKIGISETYRPGMMFEK